MNTPQIGIAVAIRKGKEILYGYRLKPIGNKTWQLPGGHLEMYETFDACAQREVKEETGLDIQNIKLVHVKNNPWKDHNAHYVTLFLVADWVKWEAVVPDSEKEKCGELRWCDVEKHPKPLFEMDKETLHKISEEVWKRFEGDERDLLQKACDWIRKTAGYAKDTYIKPNGKTILITTQEYGTDYAPQSMLEKIGGKVDRSGNLKNWYTITTPFGEYLVSFREDAMYEGCVG